MATTYMLTRTNKRSGMNAKPYTFERDDIRKKWMGLVNPASRWMNFRCDGGD
jgi:hypothetical protein